MRGPFVLVLEALVFQGSGVNKQRCSDCTFLSDCSPWPLCELSLDTRQRRDRGCALDVDFTMSDIFHLSVLVICSINLLE